MTRTVPKMQAGGGIIKYMLPVECDNNTKVTCTKATTKNDSLGEKTENSSVPSQENGANNGVRSRETAEKSDKGMVGLTVITGESTTSDVPMDVVHVVQGDIPRRRNLSNF